MSKRLFNLGQIVATPGALELLERHSMTPMQFLQRHVSGDFGDLCDEDKESNNEAIWNEERILSSYKINDDKIWIITQQHHVNDEQHTWCCRHNKQKQHRVPVKSSIAHGARQESPRCRDTCREVV